MRGKNLRVIVVLLWAFASVLRGQQLPGPPAGRVSTAGAQTAVQPAVTGRVVNSVGNPVSSATVSLVPFGFSRARRPGVSAPTSKEFPTVVTDAAGSFTLQMKQQSFASISVEANGYVTATEPLRPQGAFVPGGAQETSRTITLYKEAAVSGIVADENGAPMSGVSVVANPATVVDINAMQRTLGSARTDGDGRFTLNSVPDAPLSLRFTAPGYATGYLTASPGEPAAINLNRGATVRGQVVDLSGGPVGGVPIHLYSKNESFSVENQGKPKPFPRQWGETALSGESGAFSLRNVPPGTYVVSVASDSQDQKQKFGVWSPGKGSLTITVPEDGNPAPVSVPVFSGYTVRGRVVESGTTNTVANARVWLLYQSHPYPWTDTDAEGNFTFDGLFPQGALQFAAEADGYRTVSPTNSSWGNTTVTLTAELPTSSPLVDIKIPMQRHSAVRGVVVDAATSQPVSGAKVQAVKQRYSSTGNQDNNRPAVTGPDGRFMLECYMEEGVRLRAELAGYAPAISEPLSGLTQEDLLLSMSAGQTLRGVVVDPDNNAVAGAWVSGTIRVDTARSAAGIARLYTEDIVPRVRSGGDGTFSIENLPIYTEVSISAGADGFAASEVASYFVPKDRDMTSVTLKLRTAMRLSGRVLSPDGQPLASASLYARSNNTNGGGHYRTGADGKYTFTTLPDAPLEVQINHSQYGSEYFYDVAVGRENVDFQFGKGDKDGMQRMQRQSSANAQKTGAVLYGKVLDYKSNQPVKDYKVRCSYGGVVKPDPDVVGGFMVEGLLVGSPYQTVRITAPGYAPYDSGSLYIMPGQKRIEKTFKLGPGGSITGRAVEQATQKPLAGVIISLGQDLYSARTLPNEQKPPPVVSAADGTFTLAGVGQGRKVVSYEPPPETGYIKMTQEVDVIYNEATDVQDVEFGAGGKIKGKLVRMPGSVPIPGARIQAREQQPVTTDADGGFEFTNLLNGLYFVEAPEYGANSWIGIDKLETKELTLEVGSGRLAATVVRAGQPVSCAIKVQKVGPGQSVARMTTSDKAGQFVLEGLAPGRWGVEFTGTSGRAFTAGDYVIMPPSGEDVEKTFTLPSGTLRVAVIDAGGQPVPDAAVTVRQQSSADSALQADSQRASTGEDGISSFDALDGGTYAVTAITKNNLRGSKEGVAVENGQSAAETITLEPAEGGTLISTALNLSSGKPLATAWCYLFNENGQMFEHNRQRDELGVMTIENIPPGKYRVQVSAFSFSAAEHSVEINSGEVQNIEDVLYPAGAVRWVLRDGSGAPVVGAACTLTPADPGSIEETRTGTSNSEGMFVARGLMAGAYTATAQTRAGQSATAQVHISAANATDVISMVK